MAHSKTYDHYMYTQIISTKYLVFFLENIIMVNPTATENITAIKRLESLFMMLEVIFQITKKR